jgi:hypothetical protein
VSLVRAPVTLAAQFSFEEAFESIGISCVRVQVERDIRRAKTFSLVKGLTNAMGTRRMEIIIRGTRCPSVCLC